MNPNNAMGTGLSQDQDCHSNRGLAKNIVGDYRGSRRCKADQDGECHWKECPQIRDMEPDSTGRHCPLDSNQ